MKIKFIFLIILLPSLVSSQEKEKTEINRILDTWHQAAANADQKTYFDAIAEDGIYIGTDASEIWTKQEFFEWAKPYFEKGKAWSFTAIKRNIYFSDDLSFSWFDELLQFTDGVFRGSGVLTKKDGNWKLKHYVLSLPVPNEKFKSVMEVIQAK
ncbi:MAG: nuclear transport factor 2 family protein [Bacteroidetes bacterium]|nr:nuclear transport factor 2 family protein [Bacteroidota bacterium]